MPPRLLLLLPLLAACKDKGDLKDDTATVAAQTWVVGHATHTLTDQPERPLTIEVWYPTDAASGSPTPLPQAYLADAGQRALYEGLLGEAPAGCPTGQTDAVADVPLAEGVWPVVVMSHCHNCVRFSNQTLAVGLAAAGFVVVAPDHAGNTLFDSLAGEDLPLSTDTLALRRADLGRALDALLEGDLELDPTQLRADAVGALGHSFGSVSVGLLAQEDDRITAAVGIAAPMENPLLSGVEVSSLAVPLLFVVAGEDNSITEAGNVLLRSNFAEAPGPAWKVEVADAGHWSFSDVCGLIDAFLPGCGEDTRQTDSDETVTYPAPDETRALGAALAVAFFQSTLQGADSDRLDAVVAETAVPGVTIEQRP